MLNNYSITDVGAQLEDNRSLRTHLWGVDALEGDGWSVTHAPYEQSSAWGRALGRRIGQRFGDLDQQVGARRELKGALIYCADQYSGRGLCGLRAAGLLRSPIVAVAHHPQPTDRETRWLMRGVDVVVCLSAEVQAQLIHDFSRSRETTFVGPWGPDLESTLIVPGRSEYVVSTGKTSRDLDTLMAAVATGDYPVRAYSLTAHASPRPDVQIVTPADGQPAVAISDVLRDVADAAVVAIPHRRSDALCGLSELNDALAFGKPIVMTRTRYLDVDIERIGCGIFVDVGDVEGWRSALETLMADPDLRHRMGEAGRSFAANGWNYTRFAEQVVLAARLAWSERPADRLSRGRQASA